MLAGIILAIVSSVLSVPAAVSAPPSQSNNSTASSTSTQQNFQVIKCQGSIWMKNTTTHDSALVEDCHHLQRNIAKDVWGFDGLDIFKVGNDDIIDRIDEAVAEFALQDADGNYHVGAEGEFWCDSLMSWQDGVIWGIYRSDDDF
ncbi:hypothetical protein NEUTE2DRAFT_72090 [Neurospora tetrasperma FGSC 2509]|nr:hypothetical protein NEUTE2DRAFT_72090 [Neurospora tetrasperma FGSC 2509]